MKKIIITLIFLFSLGISVAGPGGSHVGGDYGYNAPTSVPLIGISIAGPGGSHVGGDYG